MGSTCVFSEVLINRNTSVESPFPMRRRKRSLTRRVNADLAIQFGDERLTSHAGLELLGQRLRAVEFQARARDAFRGVRFQGDYPGLALVRLLLAMLWVGARRLRHVRFLSRDPLVCRFAGLSSLPDERTLSRWLKQFNGKALECLRRLNLGLVVTRIRALALRCLTIDVDGSIISAGLQVAWAFRGFNPHHRKVPSYYPILAHLAQTGQIVGLKNRPGNVHDGVRALGFLRDLIHELRRALGRAVRLEFRFDGAFFQRPILQLLERQGCEYAIKVPMWQWLGVKEKIQMRLRWHPVAPGISAFETTLPIPKWGLRLRVVCYRKLVFHATAKNYQLDLFSPDDGTYEYSAVATNKALSVRNLWYFMAGRGAQEKTIAELKSGFAFDTVPTNHYGANSAWQWLSVLAHNLFRDLQIALQQERRRGTRKRTFLFRLQSIATARFEWLNTAGRLLTLASGQTLRLPASPEIESAYGRWGQVRSKEA
jgi:hypothetical protein